MKSVDKFGREIYPEVFKKMLEYQRVLEAHGYIESSSKPNLFYKSCKSCNNGFIGKSFTFCDDECDEKKGVVFFADMRGTEYEPIWVDPRPTFYVKFIEEMPQWKKNRIAEREFFSLHICRESNFYISGGDGYCIVCGKDFQDEGLFCSDQCEEIYISDNIFKTRCMICGKTLTANEVIEHHISYKEDRTILVCRSCHAKIHFTNKMPKLKPEDQRPKICIEKEKEEAVNIARLKKKNKREK